MVLAAPAVGTAQDTVIPDDLIVEGSICASFLDECANGELFNFSEDLKLKNTVPTLVFEDTDVDDNDWAVGSNGTFVIADLDALTSPFQIRQNAPSFAINIRPSGNVGMGVNAGAFPLHIQRNSGTATTMLGLLNNGPTRLQLDNTVGDFWVLNAANNGFRFNANGNPNVAFLLGITGNVTIAGILTEMSSRTVKTAVEPVDGKQVLATVAELPLAEWSYRDDKRAARHVGPMAEDFRASLGLGRDAQHLAALDTTGVALAAIQGLNQLLEEKDAQLTELEQQHALLMERLSALEEKLTASKNSAVAEAEP
jgi:uncharacterized coiled-coil protein SlyX